MNQYYYQYLPPFDDDADDGECVEQKTNIDRLQITNIEASKVELLSHIETFLTN